MTEIQVAFFLSGCLMLSKFLADEENAAGREEEEERSCE